MNEETLEEPVGPLILVVDDEPRNLQLVGGLLRDRGYRLLMATNGPDALETARETEPNLILLDVMMPGMDGFEVCRKLKKDMALSRIPVIFLTARTETEDIVRGFQAGGVDYITKPFRHEELLARVNTHIQLNQLKSFLAVCSYCNKIKDDDNRWVRYDAYINKKTGAHFSHSICPECYRKVMKEIGGENGS